MYLRDLSFSNCEASGLTEFVMLCAGVADEGAVSTGAPRPAERLRSSMRDFTPSVLPFVPRRREPERYGTLSIIILCEQIVLGKNRAGVHGMAVLTIHGLDSLCG